MAPCSTSLFTSGLIPPSGDNTLEQRHRSEKGAIVDFKLELSFGH